jgi:hypothetical protein
LELGLSTDWLGYGIGAPHTGKDHLEDWKGTDMWAPLGRDADDQVPPVRMSS